MENQAKRETGINLSYDIFAGVDQHDQINGVEKEAAAIAHKYSLQSSDQECQSARTTSETAEKPRCSEAGRIWAAIELKVQECIRPDANIAPVQNFDGQERGKEERCRQNRRHLEVHAPKGQAAAKASGSN